MNTAVKLVRNITFSVIALVTLSLCSADYYYIIEIDPDESNVGASPILPDGLAIRLYNDSHTTTWVQIPNFSQSQTKNYTLVFDYNLGPANTLTYLECLQFDGDEQDFEMQGMRVIDYYNYYLTRTSSMSCSEIQDEGDPGCQTFRCDLQANTDTWANKVELPSCPDFTGVPTPSPIPPSRAPSYMPTSVPTTLPSNIPSNFPSWLPSMVPSNNPSNVPTVVPTHPTNIPSRFPSRFPTGMPTSRTPTNVPSNVPSGVISASSIDTVIIDNNDSYNSNNSYNNTLHNAIDNDSKNRGKKSDVLDIIINFLVSNIIFVLIVLGLLCICSCICLIFIGFQCGYRKKTKTKQNNNNINSVDSSPVCHHDQNTDRTYATNVAHIEVINFNMTDRGAGVHVDTKREAESGNDRVLDFMLDNIDTNDNELIETNRNIAHAINSDSGGNETENEVNIMNLGEAGNESGSVSVSSDELYNNEGNNNVNMDQTRQEQTIAATRKRAQDKKNSKTKNKTSSSVSTRAQTINNAKNGSINGPTKHRKSARTYFSKKNKKLTKQTE